MLQELAAHGVHPYQVLLRPRDPAQDHLVYQSSAHASSGGVSFGPYVIVRCVVEACGVLSLALGSCPRFPRIAGPVGDLAVRVRPAGAGRSFAGGVHPLEQLQPADAPVPWDQWGHVHGELMGSCHPSGGHLASPLK